MLSVASQLIEEVTVHAQSDSLEDAQEICADGTYFPNNLCICCMRKVSPLLAIHLGLVFNLTLSISLYNNRVSFSLAFKILCEDKYIVYIYFNKYRVD